MIIPVWLGETIHRTSMAWRVLRGRERLIQASALSAFLTNGDTLQRMVAVLQMQGVEHVDSEVATPFQEVVRIRTTIVGPKQKYM